MGSIDFITAIAELRRNPMTSHDLSTRRVLEELKICNLICH
jgi:hypothetical protein